ncbi:PadR family transcriptional regulator [uncultured Enterococcus sp.]|uniref:PadR family transcriptional regulator n=1 Tax=uncultured Enterococcus sp. TaxID=167972 RepID=UPI002AA629A6|nr:PadR family transcriptional regulator [uncultured Enterococcus sp.]
MNAPLTETTYYILLSLITPLHGYGIINNVTELSNGRVNLAAGTLYGALETLKKKEYIELYKESSLRKKKEYILTEAGHIALAEDFKRLKELVTVSQEILGG